MSQEPVGYERQGTRSSSRVEMHMQGDALIVHNAGDQDVIVQTEIGKDGVVSSNTIAPNTTLTFIGHPDTLWRLIA